MKGFLYKQFTKRFRSYSLIISLLIIFSIGLNSCCTKIYCPGADDMGPIEFLNFSSDETDAVFLVYYSKNSNFKTVVDSSLLEIHQASGSDKFLGYSSLNITVDYDYRLYFTLIGKVYSISGFQTGKSVCNDCFLSKDYYTSMNAYMINGYLKNSHVLQIDRLTD